MHVAEDVDERVVLARQMCKPSPSWVVHERLEPFGLRPLLRIPPVKLGSGEVLRNSRDQPGKAKRNRLLDREKDVS